MKLAFVSRLTRTDPDHHAIVGTVSYSPASFAAQQGLSDKNSWGILKWLVGLVRTHAVNLQEDAPEDEYVAKFVLMREPNVARLSFYSVPPTAFDGEGGDDEGAEEAAAAAAGRGGAASAAAAWEGQR